MSRRLAGAWLAVLVALPGPRGLAADDGPEGLRMSKPVVCAKVHGFASFEPLPDAALTADDKLMVYYEPGGYAIERTKDGYRALFAQDGRVRKKGSKDAIWQKAPMFEYEAKNASPPYQVFMRTDLSIKGLPPGEYELDLTLHDRLAKDQGVKATRTVAFKVVPPRGEAKGDEAPGEAAKGQEPKAKRRRSR